MAKDQRIPKGIWSALNFEAIARSELMMMRAIDDIRMSWAVENDELTLEHLNREKFLDMLEGAGKDPEVYQQLQQTLARLLMPMIQMAMMPAPPEGQDGR